jgi:hypothetical protein
MGSGERKPTGRIKRVYANARARAHRRERGCKGWSTHPLITEPMPIINVSGFFRSLDESNLVPTRRLHVNSQRRSGGRSQQWCGIKWWVGEWSSVCAGKKCGSKGSPRDKKGFPFHEYRSLPTGKTRARATHQRQKQRRCVVQSVTAQTLQRGNRPCAPTNIQPVACQHAINRGRTVSRPLYGTGSRK